MARYNKYLKIKAGAGRVVDGIINLPESFKEANEAFMFVDVAGETPEDGGPRLCCLRTWAYLSCCAS